MRLLYSLLVVPVRFTRVYVSKLVAQYSFDVSNAVTFLSFFCHNPVHALACPGGIHMWPVVSPVVQKLALPREAVTRREYRSHWYLKYVCIKGVCDPPPSPVLTIRMRRVHPFMSVASLSFFPEGPLLCNLPLVGPRIRTPVDVVTTQLLPSGLWVMLARPGELPYLGASYLSSHRAHLRRRVLP